MNLIPDLLGVHEDQQKNFFWHLLTGKATYLWLFNGEHCILLWIIQAEKGFLNKNW